MTLTAEASIEDLRRGGNWEFLNSQVEQLGLEALDGYVLLRRTPFYRDLQFCLVATRYDRHLTVLSESFPDELLFSSAGQKELTEISSKFWQKVESAHATMGET